MQKDSKSTVFENIIQQLKAQKSGLTGWAEDKAFGLGIETAIKIVKRAEEAYHKDHDFDLDQTTLQSEALQTQNTPQKDSTCFSKYVNQPKVMIDGRKFVDEQLMLELLDKRIREERKDAFNEDERNAYDFVRNILANW